MDQLRKIDLILTSTLLLLYLSMTAELLIVEGVLNERCVPQKYGDMLQKTNVELKKAQRYITKLSTQ